MGHKIFISYKYADTSVQHLERMPWYEYTKVRDYVDDLQNKLKDEDQINKGEADGEDLSDFKDSTIASKLRDRIYDSTVTIVLISPNMIDKEEDEDDQWIPWEVSYSLREKTRSNGKKIMNGVLAVVLPDSNGSYNYMLESLTCCRSGCRLLHTESLFKILRENMFNRKDDSSRICDNGNYIYHGYFSYIHMIRWDQFMDNISKWIEVAETLRNQKDNYEIHINV